MTEEPTEGVPCPACGSFWHRVIRTTSVCAWIRRRRECARCGRRFNTREKAELED